MHSYILMCVCGVFLFVAYSIENNLHRFEHNMLYK